MGEEAASVEPGWSGTPAHTPGRTRAALGRTPWQRAACLEPAASWIANGWQQTCRGSFSAVSKQNLQENMRLKALAQIYAMHPLALL